MPTVETVRTNGFEMDYFRFGRGEKTLVILPGLSVQSVMPMADAIAAAYRLFADDYTVFVFDRRKELPDPYPVRDMARDTAQAFRALGLERVCLMGASQGGMIALTIAIDYPSLVGKLVVCSTSAYVLPDQFAPVEKWIALAESGDAKALYLSFGEAIYPRETFELSKGLLAKAAESVTDADLRRFAILARGIRGFDVVNYVRRLSCPTFVVGSKDDAVIGDDPVYLIANQIRMRPDCMFYMYDGYGHAVYDTAPDFKERVFGFLERE